MLYLYPKTHDIHSDGSDSEHVEHGVTQVFMQVKLGLTMYPLLHERQASSVQEIQFS